MLTKETYLFNTDKIPYTKTTVEDVGEIGLRLFLEGYSEEFSKLDMKNQVAQCVINEDGEREFSDEDIEEFIVGKIPHISQYNIVKKIIEVNGLTMTREEEKKS